MKKIYYLGAVALGLAMASCSDDHMPEAGNNSSTDFDRNYYVSMRISGDVPGSRAAATDGNPVLTDFGTGTENAVNNAFFVFYDEDGNVVGDIVEVTLDDSHIVTGEDFVEKKYKSTVSVAVRQGEKDPAQVICYINPISPGTLNVPLHQIQTVTRTEFSTEVNDQPYFAMSNSVYYDKDKNGDLVPQIAVEIPKASLKNTETEAENAEDDEYINIYVERYATKLQFSVTEGALKTYNSATRKYKNDGTTGYDIVAADLEFVPQYWAVNAQANRNYVIKSLRQESADGALLGENYKYDDLEGVINHGITTGKWTWNAPSFKRSYWGMSPAYFTPAYPEVSSDLNDQEIAAGINQTYIKYNELSTKGYSIPANANPYNSPAKYFRETTVGSKALPYYNPETAKNPAAAVASVIYVGKYKLTLREVDATGATTNTITVPDNTSFYSYQSGPVPGIDDQHPYIYFENEANSATSKVTGGESMLRRYFAAATILYKQVPELNEAGEQITDENGDPVVSYERYTVATPADVTKLVSALEIKEIGDDIKKAFDGNEETIMKIQHNARSLQFKNAGAASGIYILTANGYEEIVANGTTIGKNEKKITLTDANVLLMRQAGMCYYYTAGHAYFNIPVRHYGWSRTGNANKTAAKLDWNKVRVGDFGMVRNHSYEVEVTNVIGLAQGIGDDNTPIVPPTTPNDLFIAYSVNILKWAMVPKQSVEL